tara:strand:- start:2824 stop:3402 length:579 start_codon:yes stop_codon:yes gene_type:complete
MWYTGVGSLRHLSEKNIDFLREVGEALALSGFNVRTGGRGVLDDTLRDSCKSSGGVTQVLTPSPFYRDYNATKEDDVFSYSTCPLELKENAKKIMHDNGVIQKATSEFHSNLLYSSPLILLGPNLDAPSRFLITWQNDLDGEVFPDCRHFETQESPIFKLAQKKKIPIFNIANPLHKERIESFIDTVKNKSA